MKGEEAKRSVSVLLPSGELVKVRLNDVERMKKVPTNEIPQITHYDLKQHLSKLLSFPID